MSVRPSVCQSQSVRLSACVSSAPTGRISVKFRIGSLLRKYIEKIQIWLTLEENIWHFTRRPEFILLLPAKLNHHKSALFERNGMKMLGYPRWYKYYANSTILCYTYIACVVDLEILSSIVKLCHVKLSDSIT
jgi:hypothetical protein